MGKKLKLSLSHTWMTSVEGQNINTIHSLCELTKVIFRGVNELSPSPSPTRLELGSLCFYEARARLGSSLLI
ncbi:hypothetical protein Hanom_Chr03g00197771 [Helianthus anomalus]